MKYIRQGKRVKCKLNLPEDLHWKIYRSLLGDLGFLSSYDSKDSLLNPIPGSDSFSSRISGIIRNRDHSELYALLPELEPLSILRQTGDKKEDAFAFFAYYQAGSFLKKFPFKGTDTKSPAIKKFFDAERICETFNNENYKGLVGLSSKHPDYLGVIEELQADILDLLGDFPDHLSVTDHAAHGPGVSLGDLYKEGKTTDYFKWSSLPYSVTQGALPLAKAAVSSDPRWIGALDDWYRTEKSIPIGHPIDVSHFWDTVFKVVDCSRVTTVPKTAIIDRTIAIEPLLNVYLQLGVDRVFKTQLRKKWGYDLYSQERNQRMALKGSVTGDSVTVDLSMASDTISLRICEILLPPAWYNLLLDLRSPLTEVDGAKHPLAKISSMGNGFTFALESIVFGALVRLAIRRTKSVRESAVYGDDLIVPLTAKDYLYTMISYCGFKVNDGKSYCSGPFRESCGSDYFSGYHVRPVFLKRNLRSVKDLLYIHNSLCLLEQNLDWTWGVNFENTRELILKYIPKNIRDQYYGPISESLDTHLFSERRLRRNQFGQRVYWQISAKPRKFNGSCRSFFFRKLMNQLRPRFPTSKWDSKRRLNTGNAFDVTKRDKVLYTSAKVCIP